MTTARLQGGPSGVATDRIATPLTHGAGQSICTHEAHW